MEFYGLFKNAGEEGGMSPCPGQNRGVDTERSVLDFLDIRGIMKMENSIFEKGGRGDAQREIQDPH